MNEIKMYLKELESSDGRRPSIDTPDGTDRNALINKKFLDKIYFGTYNIYTQEDFDRWVNNEEGYNYRHVAIFRGNYTLSKPINLDERKTFIITGINWPTVTYEGVLKENGYGVFYYENPTDRVDHEIKKIEFIYKLKLDSNYTENTTGITSLFKNCSLIYMSRVKFYVDFTTDTNNVTNSKTKDDYFNVTENTYVNDELKLGGFIFDNCNILTLNEIDFYFNNTAAIKHHIKPVIGFANKCYNISEIVHRYGSVININTTELFSTPYHFCGFYDCQNITNISYDFTHRYNVTSNSYMHYKQHMFNKCINISNVRGIYSNDITIKHAGLYESSVLRDCENVNNIHIENTTTTNVNKVETNDNYYQSFSSSVLDKSSNVCNTYEKHIITFNREIDNKVVTKTDISTVSNTSNNIINTDSKYELTVNVNYLNDNIKQDGRHNNYITCLNNARRISNVDSSIVLKDVTVTGDGGDKINFNLSNFANSVILGNVVGRMSNEVEFNTPRFIYNTYNNIKMVSRGVSKRKINVTNIDDKSTTFNNCRYVLLTHSETTDTINGNPLTTLGYNSYSSKEPEPEAILADTPDGGWNSIQQI